MLGPLVFGAVAALLLLVLDLGLRTAMGHADATAPGPRLLLAARVVAIFLLAATLATACRTEDLAGSAAWAALFGAAGLAAFELALGLTMRPLRGVIAAARGGNLAAAVAFAAHTVAVGILVANAFGGTSWTDLGLAFGSLAVGLLTLVLLGLLWRLLTAYDDRARILGDNVAAGLAHGGLVIALALVIAHAADGEYLGPWPALREYGVALAEGLLVWPLRQLVVQCLILRARPTLYGGALDRAIAEHGDVGAGALEAGTYLAVALFVVRLA